MFGSCSYSEQGVWLDSATGTAPPTGTYSYQPQTATLWTPYKDCMQQGFCTSPPEDVKPQVPLIATPIDSVTSLPGNHEVWAPSPGSLPDVNATETCPKKSESAAGRAPMRTRESGKPPFSYITLICMAIANHPEKKATLKEIIAYVENRFPFYQTRTSWHATIRHNLTLNDCFVKSGRRPGERGHCWTIDPNFNDMFDGGSLLRRRYRFKDGKRKPRENQKNPKEVVTTLRDSMPSLSAESFVAPTTYEVRVRHMSTGSSASELSTATVPASVGCPSALPASAGCPSALPASAGCPSALPTSDGCPSALPTSDGCPSALPTSDGCPSALPTWDGCPSALPNSSGIQFAVPTLHGYQSSVLTSRSCASTIPTSDSCQSPVTQVYDIKPQLDTSYSHSYSAVTSGAIPAFPYCDYYHQFPVSYGPHGTPTAAMTYNQMTPHSVPQFSTPATYPAFIHPLFYNTGPPL